MNDTPNFSRINNDSFRLEPRQQKIYERLLRLVSESAAGFYHDACRHMAEPVGSSYSATTNIVGHLIREVESSLRDVLEPFTGRSSEEVQKCEGCGNLIGERKKCDTCGLEVVPQLKHVDEIKLILKGLDIDESDPIAEAWLSVPGKKGLQKFTHRRGLKNLRKVDEDFLEFWNKLEAILYGILDKFEARYTVIFKKIDDVMQKPEPTSADAAYLSSNVPNTAIAYDRIFRNLDNQKWLTLLNSKGFFNETPPPIYGEYQGSQTVSYPAWPAAPYLKKMAPVNPGLVKQILLDLPETKNETVKASLIDIATELPTEERREVFDRIKTWMDAQHHYFINDATNNLFLKSIDDNEIDAAFDAVTLLLDFKPDPRSEKKKSEFSFSYDPVSRLDDWHYARFVEGPFKKLVDIDPKRSLETLSKVLENFVTLKYQDRTNPTDYEDYMYISRPAIEEHEQNRNHREIENSLISSIRDIAHDIIKSDITLFKEIIDLLESHKWTIFKRIAIYLISQHPDIDTGLTNKYLANPDLFDNSNVEHEYVQLMTSGFPFLADENKNNLFAWIEKAEYINDLLKKMQADSKEPLDDEYKKKKIEYWQHEQLYFIKDHLMGTWKDRYEALSANYEDPKYPGFPAYMSSYVGPSSAINAVTIESMSEEELLQLLKTWKPENESDHFGPSKDGLSRELAVAIKRKPDFFASLAEKLIGLDPTYIRSYLQVFQELIQNDYELNWDTFISLCEWVVQQPIAIPNRKGDVFDQDPDWEWTRKSVASLISRGLNDNEIPYRLRERVWGLIEPLTDDPNPTPEQEVDSKGKRIKDAYSLTINTTRGDAVSAVVEYALWVHRNIEDTEGKEKLESGFLNMPEVKKVLEKHLDPSVDPSIAVRAVYGRFFPWLLLLDKKWTKENVKLIFPENGFGTPLYDAAWDTYVSYVPAYNEPFECLRNEYQVAVEKLGEKEDDEKTHRANPEEHLVTHLMSLYWRDQIKLDDPLLTSLWNIAGPKIRGFALDSLGRGILDENLDIPPDVIKRLMVLWEYRLKTAEESTDKSQYEEEMSAFGWWFASNKFDLSWSCDQYLKALDIGVKTQSDYYVTKQLVNVIEILPIKAINILQKLIEIQQRDWIIFGNKTEITNVLTLGLKSPNAEARKLTEELINRLVSKGYSDFETLLSNKEQPINQQEDIDSSSEVKIQGTS